MFADRWAEAGALIRDPVSRLRFIAETGAKARAHDPDDAGFRAELERIRMESLRETATMLVCAMRAANRMADAEAVAAAARAFDPSPEMAAALEKVSAANP